MYLLQVLFLLIKTVILAEENCLQYKCATQRKLNSEYVAWSIIIILNN